MRRVQNYVQRVQHDLQTLNSRLSGSGGGSAAAKDELSERQGVITGAGGGLLQPGQSAMNVITNTVNEINKTVSDMVNRVRATFAPIFGASGSSTAQP